MERTATNMNRQFSTANDNAVIAMQILKNQGKCLHMLNGNISYGLCSRGYSCNRCSFDQMVEDAGYLTN